ncbi:M28 family peptidase [Mucilaginibacter sp.]|uniref:M28 family peptidase n=1 Tax=Mucilaginibacter sp. TaxID=1882438 RepID=UPI003D122983
MKKTLLVLASVGLVTVACAQQNPTAVKYAQIIDADLAKKHLSIIASDAFEGRETGKPGADKAAHYIADEFKSLGLQPIVKGSYFLDVPLVENVFKVSAFTINGTSYTSGKDFYASGSGDAKTITASDIVFIGYGIGADNYDDLKGTDITGKVVLYINDGEPFVNGVSKITGTDKKSDWSTNRSKRLKFIQSKNPLLILSAGPNVAANLKRFGAQIGAPRLTIKKEATEAPKAQAAVFNITTDVADQLLKNSGRTYAKFKAAIDEAGTPQTQPVRADISTTYATEGKDVKAVDVLGYLPGSDPKLKDEVVVISAHYDHIGLLPEGTKGDRINNGADDDGSGTTGILEIARAFSKAKKDGHGPRRSILFLGNVGEEKGLLGSEYYTDHPVIPLGKTITDLNIDMIGRVGYEYIGKPDSANYVYVIGSGMLSTDLHNANDKANKTYTKMDLDYKYDDPNDPNSFYTRSDHYNFAKHGVPIIFYFNGVHADYHGVGDEVSKINFPLLAKRAQLVFYTAWDILNADNRPVVDGKK